MTSGNCCSIIVILICAIGGAIAFAESPSPDPNAIWKYITKESPYAQNGHFGQIIKVYNQVEPPMAHYTGCS